MQMMTRQQFRKLSMLLLVLLFGTVLFIFQMKEYFTHKTYMMNTYYADSRSLQDSILDGLIVPKSIYYIWCHKHTIKYQHYLSILSVWKHMQPDVIKFYHWHVIKDDDPYNLLLQELKQSLPNLAMIEMPKTIKRRYRNRCTQEIGLNFVRENGGMYINENVLISHNFKNFQRRRITMGYVESRSYLSFVLSVRNNSFPSTVKNRKLSTTNKSTLNIQEGNILKCTSLTLERLQTNFTSKCVELPDLYPIDIMHLNTNFGADARRIAYGSPNIVESKSNVKGHIPKYVHFVWFVRKEMDFAMYLSIRSALLIINPEKLVIHGDFQLYGHYLDKIKKDPRVLLVYRERPQQIFGHKLRFIEHLSDIVRLDVLLKYGGIYLDWDVFWLKPVDDLKKGGYDTIASFGALIFTHGYPNRISMGPVLSKPNSSFLRLWEDTLHDYKTNDFIHNAMELPYKVFEHFPSTIFILPELQVLCRKLVCRQEWSRKAHDFNDDDPIDAYAIHVINTSPPEFENESALLNGKGRWKEIGKMIFQLPSKFGV